MRRRNRAVTGTAALLAIAVVTTGVGPVEALELELSIDDCVLSTETRWAPRAPLVRDALAVFDVDVVARDDCSTERLVAIAAAAVRAAEAALGTAPEWRRSSELTLRVADDELAFPGLHGGGVPVASWDELRRRVDGSVSARVLEGDATLEIALDPAAAATPLDTLALLLDPRSAISGGAPEWTIRQAASETRGASEILVRHDRPVAEIVSLTRELDAAFSGVRSSSVQLNGAVLSIAARGDRETAGDARTLRASTLWPRVLATMTALTDRGSGYAIGGEIAAEAADGSGFVDDSFSSSSMACTAPPQAGETTLAAFEHLSTVIRAAHPGQSFPFGGLTAPACR